MKRILPLIFLFQAGLLLLACSLASRLPGAQVTPAPVAPATSAATPLAVSTPAPSEMLPTTATSPTLKPADSEFPAAGICDEVDGEIATITIYSGIPDPRCLVVYAGQRLKVVNASGEEVRFTLGPFDVLLAPEDEQIYDRPVDEYLAPGVHNTYISIFYGGAGGAVWLVDE
jgi:hypothetical protein